MTDGAPGPGKLQELAIQDRQSSFHVRRSSRRTLARFGRYNSVLGLNGWHENAEARHGRPEALIV
ncbi:hypothetical protein BD309DRAFT_970202, partial [Dichomitus squalens]